ncbi:MAG: CIA30 family protein [Paracoccaceae bacterium]
MTPVTRRRFLTLAGAGCLIGLPAHGAGILRGDMTPAEDLEWRYVADTVMGGVSEGAARIEADGDTRYIRLKGTVSTENRGGFIQARTTLDTALAADAQGLRLKLRGNEERYFVHLRTGATLLPWQYYQAPFESSTGWQITDIPFTAFKPSGRLLPGRVKPDSIQSIGLVAYGRDHEADLSVAALGAY